jgi:CheY-like chemotaxis protein
VKAPSRRGFGSTIIERSIPFELGGEASVSFRLTGLEAEFCVPARYVAGVKAQRAAPSIERQGDLDRARILEGMSVLLLEDSMLVALDAEDALRALGAESVTVAPSLRAAEKLLETGAPDFAVLDFNLGGETSLPIAEQLRQAGLPFVLATGYGQELNLPAGLAEQPLVTKPYDAGSLSSAIERALARPA